ncbi:MAG: hypothetical protein NVS4B3_17330 [Gemmatimonadaceae bacterium]
MRSGEGECDDRWRVWQPLGLLAVLAIGVESPAVALSAVSASVMQSTPGATIVIDPGHPSETSAGVVRRDGVTEVHVAWDIALRLGRLLERRGYRVVLTKTREQQLVRNRNRAELANRVGATLMVRLHCDASADHGFALYYPDRAGTVDGHTGPSNSIIRQSHEAADSLHAAMSVELAGLLKDGGIRGDSRTAVGGHQGALTGSIFADIPVVTVEMVVLSNDRDARFIAGRAGAAAMAHALADGIARYARPPQPF